MCLELTFGINKTNFCFSNTIILLLLSVNVFAQKQSASAVVGAFYKFHWIRSGIFNAKEVDLYKLFQNELKCKKEYLKQNPTDKLFYGDGFPFQPLDEC